MEFTAQYEMYAPVDKVRRFMTNPFQGWRSYHRQTRLVMGIEDRLALRGDQFTEITMTFPKKLKAEVPEDEELSPQRFEQLWLWEVTLSPGAAFSFKGKTADGGLRARVHYYFHALSPTRTLVKRKMFVEGLTVSKKAGLILAAPLISWSGSNYLKNVADALESDSLDKRSSNYVF